MKPADVRRLGAATAAPGNDPRIWAACARIEKDGVQWHPKFGWVLDVETYGSRVDSENDIPSRVAGSARGNGTGEFLPPEEGQEVLLSICGGSLEENPVVAGYCTNADSAAPTEIHGMPINGDSAASSESEVSPFDTEIKVSKFSRREQYAGRREVWSSSDREQVASKKAIVCDDVRLGGDDAGEQYVLGNSHNTALLAALDAIAEQVSVLSGLVIDPSQTGAQGLVKMKAALEIQKQLIQKALSEKIRGE